MIKKLFLLWLKISGMAIQTQLTSTWAAVIFFFGKVIRFFFFLIFIFSVLKKTGSLAGYSSNQIILFFLIFNLIDIITQVLFRGVYQFRRLVVSGDFDLLLLQPIPSFFRPIFGWSDIFDFMTLIPLWIYFFTFIFRFHLFAGTLELAGFFLLLINSIFLSFAFHLFVCSVGVLTTEIDHLVMVYRDLTNMARFPTDIYQKGIQFILTFTIPVVVLMTIPAKVLMGLLNWQEILVSIVICGVFLFLSFKFWRYALKNYSSASS